MKYLNLCLLILLCNFFLPSLNAQTAEEIITKHVEAIGGKDTLSKINSVYYENTLEVMGTESINSRVVLDGKGAKSISDINGQKMVQCFTDKGGWAINPMAGSSEAVDMSTDEYNAGKNQMYVTDPLVDYVSKGYKVELVGSEKLDSVNAFNIKAVSSDNLTFNFYIDPSTYYILKVILSGKMMDQNVTITNTLSDYRKTERGIVLPYKTEVDFGGQFSIVLNIKKVEFNKTIDPTIFEKGNLTL